MSGTVTLEEAQAHLADLISKLGPGDEVVILKDDLPVAKLTAEQSLTRKQRRPGSAKGKLIIHAEDNEHLQDFRVYEC